MKYDNFKLRLLETKKKSESIKYGLNILWIGFGSEGGVTIGAPIVNPLSRIYNIVLFTRCY